MDASFIEMPTPCSPNFTVVKFFLIIFKHLCQKFQMPLTFTGPCGSARPHKRLKTLRHLVMLKIMLLHRIRHQKNTRSGEG